MVNKYLNKSTFTVWRLDLDKKDIILCKSNIITKNTIKENTYWIRVQNISSLNSFCGIFE